MAKTRKVKVQDKGLGDVIETVIKTTGVKKLFDVFLDGVDCGCEARKKKLNNITGTYLKSRCMTEQEYNEWKDFKENLKGVVNNEGITYISKLYASLFSLKEMEPCRSCKPSKINGMIQMINKVHNIYKKDLNNE